MGRPAENKGIYQGIELGNGDYALVAVLDVKDGEATPPASESADEPGEDSKQQQAVGESEFNQLVSGLKAGAEIKDYSAQLSGS
ncbi:peptidyl-prolyl cis-trans isomerase D [Candidatus Thiomargarita nelsonii]|uniref:Peptidyl-prolyl cis-trans isomerase D n=1 Tax=Candidatus Thiomargarita nelsonii TaxID=1003181 RepID=A0A176S4L4_9GAMM|nr:peptidyl-prolyl cis-trans isomerase D [Candidatus Thiomargarita nelsonii]